MNYLVDTHALLWFIASDDKLPRNVKNIIEDADNRCLVSIAAYWEIAIKFASGKLILRTDLANIFTIIEESGFEILPIYPSHLLINAQLTFHHQDPFDRVMISQAIEEELTLLSKDNKFSEYPVNLKWTQNT